MVTHAYDGCPACQDAQARRLARIADEPDDAKKPTAEALEKHAARFGPEGVVETALEHGLTVDVSGAKTPTRPRRRRR